VSAVPVTGAAASGAGLLRRFASQEALLTLAVIALAIVVGLINPRFLATRNLSDILLGNAYIAIAAIGMSMVIISGNIDISVGALIGVLATLSGSMAVAGAPTLVTWAAPLVLGVAVMAAQGAVIAYLRIPAIVVTLGMLSILKGGLISVTGGKWITDLPPSFHLADLSVLGAPMPVVIMVAATVLAALWMRSSPSGRAIYATGGNAEAARNNGIATRRVKMICFVLVGGLAGLAGAIQFGYIQYVPGNAGVGFELQVIAAAVIGGVGLFGGRGTILGSLLGAVILAELTSGLVMIGARDYWDGVAAGVVIVVAVALDELLRRGAARTLARAAAQRA